VNADALAQSLHASSPDVIIRWEDLRLADRPFGQGGSGKIYKGRMARPPVANWLLCAGREGAG
jgi:hypothetical protein